MSGKLTRQSTSSGYHLNRFCSIVRRKSMLNPWIFRKSCKLTFWYFSALIFYVHSPMCECNACDNVSLEVFASIKLHSLISHFYKMKDSHNWPHLCLVCGVARELCPIKIVFPEFTVKETRSQRQSMNSLFPVSVIWVWYLKTDIKNSCYFDRNKVSGK